MPQGRFLYLDPSLRDEHGHHLPLARALTAPIEAERVVYAVHRRAGSLGFRAGQVLPTFACSMQQAARVRRYGRLALRLGEVGQRFGIGRPRPLATTAAVGRPAGAQADASRGRSLHTHDLLAAVAVFAPGPRDALVVASADAEQGLSIAELLEGEAKDEGYLVHLRLMYDDRSRHATDYTWSSVLARLLAAPGARARLRLSAETGAFASWITSETGVPASVWPHPSLLHPTPPPAHNGLVLFVPGEARADKGHQRFQSLLARLETHRGIRVRVQAAVTGACVEQLPAHLGEAAYREAWTSAHAALLLHDPATYRLRGSGVVCDAVAACRPFVCLEGTSLAEWARDGNALVAAAEPDALADAVGRLASDYGMLSTRTAAAQMRFRDMLDQASANLLNPSH